MKVLFFNSNEGYPGGMNYIRIHLYAKGLLASGLDTEIIIPSNRKWLTSGIYEGVRFSTIRKPFDQQTRILKQISSFAAAIYYANYCLRSAKKIKTFLIYDFGWFTSFLIIACLHFRGARGILEVNENPYAPEGGRLDPVWIRKIRRFLMLNTAYRIADGFIVISEALEKMINNYKKKKAGIIYVPIITEELVETPNQTIRPEYPFVLHAGALSETKDGVTAMFEGFAKACKKLDVPLRFILTTKTMHPGMMKKIESIIDSYGINDRVIFKGSISKEELDKLKGFCSTVIINKPSNWQNDYNFPGKLSEMMAAGVPVITSLTGEIGKYIKDNETAFIVPANDSDKIAEKIVFIINNPEIAHEIGQKGKKFVLEKFHYLNYSDKLAGFFKSFSN